jgi:hypothetical protein
MPNENAGTTPESAEAQPEAQAPVVTPQTPDEVTTLRSRNAGLDAKVTELQKASALAEARAAEAAQKLSDYESGKVQADEALRAQLQAKDEELARERNERRGERIQSRFPETYGVLGEAALSLTEDQLAASEARFVGQAETPVPVGSNPARPANTSKRIEDMTAAELRVHMRTLGNDAAGAFLRGDGLSD